MRIVGECLSVQGNDCTTLHSTPTTFEYVLFALFVKYVEMCIYCIYCSLNCTVLNCLLNVQHTTTYVLNVHLLKSNSLCKYTWPI